MENILKTRFEVSVYYPTYHTYVHGKRQSNPLFTGYIFIQIDLQIFSLSRINACPGVFRVVEFGGEPYPVPGYVLDEIALRSERMNMLDKQPFQPGDTVRFKYNGPLRDLEMIFVGPMTSDCRVNVLLRFLGRLKNVRIDINALEKSSSSFSEEVMVAHDVRRKRLTRGKGRKIKTFA